MATGVTGIWELIVSFIASIAYALRVNVVEAILIALFEKFFTFIFVTLNNGTLAFMLILTTFMLIFYWRFVRG